MDALSYNTMNWQNNVSSSAFVCYVEDTSDPVFSIAPVSVSLEQVY